MSKDNSYEAWSAVVDQLRAEYRDKLPELNVVMNKLCDVVEATAGHPGDDEASLLLPVRDLRLIGILVHIGRQVIGEDAGEGGETT